MTDREMLELAAKVEEALEFYAEGEHFIRVDPNAWDTVSGEPVNLWKDAANTATIEDGTIARFSLSDLRNLIKELETSHATKD